ncbi:cytidylate kinase [Ectothiorhodospira mobilis]|uniref:Cytidylate kinase n=1 Tax=Ectothiorhodospira mobilis TaxID=195064 RepID=A0A1I4PN40_ECTMO|nr:(d)CMP kinase [Ectothiorhodospira mobilis]SFM29138.1 cytidylate kinase [Ectothiorhodospira mobilis]
MSVPVITIDGPGGSGKGTVSRLLAERLGWSFLDSGALYRLVALAALRRELPLDDADALAELARGLDVRFELDGAGESRTLLDGEVVASELRTEACGEAASRVAAIPAVREALLARQRDFQSPPGLVADGRDMGTVVFPHAPLKIFLTASREERARRRFKQLKEQGLSANLQNLLRELAERDRRDSERAVAPLRPAEDALEVDSTDMGIDAVLTEIVQAARQRGLLR